MNKVSYNIQATILDEFVHQNDLSKDPEGVQIVLSALKKREDLSEYFFSRRPSPAWAPLLLQQGFFNTPPEPEQVENGYRVPVWRLSRYLSDVAPSMPDIVVEVVNRTDTNNASVCLDLVTALGRIPAHQAVPALDKVIAWLDKNMLGWGFKTEIFDLVTHLAREDEIEGALRVFRSLSEPIPSTRSVSYEGVLAGGEARSKFEQARSLKRYWLEPLQVLGEKAPEQLAEILEANLIQALEFERDVHGRPNAFLNSWWRSAIEDSAQDRISDYKDDLLVALRDLLVNWVRGGSDSALAYARELLESEYIILRQLGLHVLRIHPNLFRFEVRNRLISPEILDDVQLHHEVFLLLRDCFSILDGKDQHTVLTNILAGPDLVKVRELAERAHREYGEDIEEYIRRHRAFWIRDRLWMIRTELPQVESARLSELIREYGEPEHPDFLIWSSGGFRVNDRSPLSTEQLSQMSDDQILVFAHTWNPAERIRSGSEVLSHEGFAEGVADLILGNQDRKSLIPQLFNLRPTYASKFYLRLDELIKNGKLIPWHEVLALAEEIVDNTQVDADSSDEYTDWRAVKVSITDVFDKALKADSLELDEQVMQRIRDLLLKLIYDPDPDQQADNPSEGWLGYGDPLTIALNHVRPRALMTLLEYSLRRARINRAEGINESGDRWESVVRDAVTDKLDRSKDPSWSVHTVYGLYLPKLYFFDKAWLDEQIDKILPENEGAASARYFAAAWESYVLNEVSAILFERLRSKYVRAILNLAEGQVTHTHLEPDRHLAGHILSEYLNSDYQLLSSAGKNNLLRLFMEKAPSRARGSAIWVLWQWLKDDEGFRREKWSRARALWAWRTQEASLRGYPSDFADEFVWFAHYPGLAIGIETMQSLWPLLQGLLPYITNDEHGAGWMAIEEYLAQEVRSDPVNVIKYYRLMHEQPTIPQWLFYGDEAEKIMRGALDAPETREQAIELADLLARRKNFRFLELVKTYQGSN